MGPGGIIFLTPKLDNSKVDAHAFNYQNFELLYNNIILKSETVDKIRRFLKNVLSKNLARNKQQ